MDKIRIRGARPVNGAITIGGAKNAALPLMVASLLTEQPLTLEDVPHLADIATLCNLLAQHGVEISFDGTARNHGADARVMTLKARNITSTVAPYDLVRKMRATFLVLGPLVARFGRARVSLPGGCAIGTRPVDLHIKGLSEMGASIEIDSGYVVATAPDGLHGASVVFPSVSVGATENLMMAATLARGETRLVNAAREPEIVDLGRCLIDMGAEIEGLGSDTVRIYGRESLGGGRHAVVPDRIEAGTYAMAAAITGGTLELVNSRLEHLTTVAKVLSAAGVSISRTDRGIMVSRANGVLRGIDVMTEPFPGFPTDLQAQMMALMTTADGAAMITETIFENRYMHVPELMRMGANITIHRSSALVRGVAKLTGAPVMATDLRASVSLVLAGLAADGLTEINRVYHLDRGYERLEEKLAACGADIERVKGD